MLDVTNRHPSVRDIARLLDSQHLPPELRDIAVLFEQAAGDLLAKLDDGPRLASALNHLWEAKNDAVGHAVIVRDGEQGAPPITHLPGERVPR